MVHPGILELDLPASGLRCPLPAAHESPALRALHGAREMVNQVHAGASTIQISDYTTNVAVPALVAYKIDVRDGEWVPTQHDPNPDIERSRFLFRYEWTVRS